MSKKDKLLEKFKASKTQFEWNELVALLKSLGFKQIEGSGSCVEFEKNGLYINLHRLHPQKEIKAYALK